MPRRPAYSDILCSVEHAYNWIENSSTKRSHTQDTLNPKLDRLNLYDHAGRITQAKSGAEARGLGESNPTDNLPYRQYFGWDAYGHFTGKNSLQWNNQVLSSYPYSNNNNRINGYTYDADGNPIVGEGTSKIDSVGRSIQYDATEIDDYSTEDPNTGFITLKEGGTTIHSQSFYDGNGREIKRLEGDCFSGIYEIGNPPSPCTLVMHPTRYFIRSSPFGNEILTKITPTGKKSETVVLAAGIELAKQSVGYIGSTAIQTIHFEYKDASSMSRRKMTETGAQSALEGENGPIESDPFGSNVGQQNPYPPEPPPPPGVGSGGDPIDTFQQASSLGLGQKCFRDGISVPCSMMAKQFEGKQFDLMQMVVWSSTSRRKLGHWERTIDNPNSPDKGDAIQVGLYDKSKLYDVFEYLGSGGVNWSAFSWQEWTPVSGGQNKKPSDLAPNGLASKTKLSAKDCDKYLAQIFGGEGALVGSTHDPLSLGAFDRFKDKDGNIEKDYTGLPKTDGSRALGHGPALFPEGGGSDVGGIIHVYGDARGEVRGSPLFAPAINRKNGDRISKIFIDRLKNQVRRVTYGTGLTITFVHTAPSKGNAKNELGSVQIGNIGGAGGSTSGYIHSHLIFYSNFGKLERVDPREVFCGW